MDGSQEAEPVALAQKLQILSTEHWSLLASRSLAWTESFNRATMFLAVLSGAVVALALVAQASQFGSTFRMFALVLLPVVLFIGIATLIRLAAANYHDAICVAGMNRIRHAYLEMAPDLEKYFVMSPHDDRRGITITMGLPPAQPQYLHFLAATPTVITVINSIVAGVIATVAVSFLTLPAWVGAVAATGGFAVTFALQQVWGMRQIGRSMATMQPRFPGGPGLESPLFDPSALPDEGGQNSRSSM
jgi:hypothetical protein